jgi:hypothetical protein
MNWLSRIFGNPTREDVARLGAVIESQGDKLQDMLQQATKNPGTKGGGAPRMRPTMITR